MNTTSRLPALLGAVVVACLTAVLLTLTSRALPIVWDEGDTITRAEQIAHTFNTAGTENNAPLIETLQLRDNWPYTTEVEGHPPLAGILIALGAQIAPGGLTPLTQARFAHMLLYAIAAGAMFYRMQRDYGIWAVSVLSVAVLVTMPRMFAHAHFATLDGPLTACWVLAWAAWSPACRDWRLIPFFAIALGLTITAKFTGWLAPFPFLVWTVLYRDSGGVRALAISVPVAVAIFIGLNPPLWTQPLIGLGDFFDLNLSRALRPRLNISTQFFGQMYNLDHPLPWYNTAVWTAITISPMSLAVGIGGIVSSLRRWQTDRTGMLLVCLWATLMVARATPMSPPHDGERLILPSFAFFAALAGVGIGRALYRDTLLEPKKIVAQGWAKILLMIVLAAATFDAVSYFPHGLSYYNRLIGGLRGATALGMEPTYYWDALDREALAWLHENTTVDEKVLLGAGARRNYRLMKRWGMLRRLPNEPGEFRWYVIQRRPSALTPADRWLIENETPVKQIIFKGVPLLDIYPFKQYQHAQIVSR